MASVQFPLSGPDDGPSGPSDLYEASAADDPGYLASVRSSSTVLGQLRTTVAALVAAPVLILAISPLIVPAGQGRLDGLGPLLCLPVLALGAAALVFGPRAPRPLPPGGTGEAAVRRAGLLFRQAIMFRYALSEATILVGLPLAMVGRSVWIFVFAFAVGYPILVWLTVPTTARIEAVRRRLESGGAPSFLWTALLAPPRRP
ncbi:hypothetical protein [Actinomadura gamaensis]|uniref:Uncharacterized protein n=1 Tax=Actinomadura gamaensis TaxID=1763541 RepID=A0ABV9U1M6_9ACTN